MCLNQCGRRPPQVPSIRGGVWPVDVEFSNNYKWAPGVPDELATKYRPAPGPRPRAARPCPRVYVGVISDLTHPAHGQCGLFCGVQAGLAPGAWVLDYVGEVAAGDNQDKSSDYVCDFGDRSELALDANRYSPKIRTCLGGLFRSLRSTDGNSARINQPRYDGREECSSGSLLPTSACLGRYGNEGRYLNDFRNTGRHHNVEFKLRRDSRGELRQGIFVCDKRGVAEHEELLVSYGKPYWRARVGNLTDFITRLPGQPAPALEVPRASELR